MLTIAAAAEKDSETIASLLEELDRFYGETTFASTDQRVGQIKALLFRPHPAAYVLLAREGDDAVGLAAYTFVWPAVGITRSLYLKELYVSQRRRKSGIGRGLMKKICEIAQESECSRVEWTTDRTNDDAIAFYEALGFLNMPTKVFYRIERNNFSAPRDADGLSGSTPTTSCPDAPHPRRASRRSNVSEQTST